MSKEKLKWIVYVLVIVIFCLAVYLAESVDEVLSDTFFDIYLWALVNAFVLVIAYAVSRRLRDIAFWRFIVYLAFATAGSVCINFLLISTNEWNHFTSQLSWESLALGCFVILIFFHFALSRIIFSMKMKGAIIFSIVMSLATIISSGPYCK